MTIIFGPLSTNYVIYEWPLIGYELAVKEAVISGDRVDVSLQALQHCMLWDSVYFSTANIWNKQEEK